jgi:hypothetical protein
MTRKFAVNSVKEYRPWFTNRDGSVRHWHRVDRFFRSRNGQFVWMILDNADWSRYDIWKLDARNPAKPEKVMEIDYTTETVLTDYQVACEWAHKAAEESSRAHIVGPGSVPVAP